MIRKRKYIYIIYWGEKSMCKLGQAVQIHVVQASTVVYLS